MGRLREKMEADLTLRRLAPTTTRGYLRYAQRFADHYPGRSPLKLGEDEVRGFLLHMVEKEGISPSTQVVCVAAVKFLYRVTLNLPEVVARIPYPKRAYRLPTILSGSEVEKLLRCITSIRVRLVCAVLYAAGLRISEACQLGPGQIDSRRGLIHVHGKGQRDRLVPMGNRVLGMLREYWRIRRPEGRYLFPGNVKGKPITQVAVSLGLRQGARAARITKRVHPHILRHSYATHQLERGVDIRSIQLLLGHARIDTTLRYLRVTPERLSDVKSPFDVLGTREGEVLG